MQRDANTFLSTNERTFVLQGLAEDVRIDGRRLYERRPVFFEFALDGSSVVAKLGDTAVLAVIHGTLEEPRSQRPHEGSVRFNVELSAMASPAYDGRASGESRLLARALERNLRDSGMLDMEALCVAAGRKAWALQVDVRVLDHHGNLHDAATLAAVAALMSFRRPEVTVGTPGSPQAFMVHPPGEREPLALSLHHLPMPVTFALFEGGDRLVVDPHLKEEIAAAGALSCVINNGRQLCCLDKQGGEGLSMPQIMRLVRIAETQATDMLRLLKAAVDAHEIAKRASRIRRRHDVPGQAGTDEAVVQLSVPESLLKPKAGPSSQLPVLLQATAGLHLGDLQGSEGSHHEVEERPMGFHQGTQPRAARLAAGDLAEQPQISRYRAEATADASELPSTSQPSPHQAQSGSPQRSMPAASSQPPPQPSSQQDQLPGTSQPSAMLGRYTERDSCKQPPGRQNAPKSQQHTGFNPSSATARGLSGQRAEPEHTTKGFGLQAGTASDDLAFLVSLIAGEEVQGSEELHEAVKTRHPS